MTYIVTGGSSGIGESVVKLLEKQGEQVLNLDIELGKYGTHIQCDLTNPQAIEKAMSQISNTTSQIKGLVSNAGMHVSATIEDTSESLFEKVMSLNVKAAFLVTKYCLPLLKPSGGSIVYVASDQAMIAKHNSFAYNLSKHALASMAKTTALDYAANNIRANAVCPGTIETPLYHKAINNYCASSGRDKTEVHKEEAALQPMGRLGKPDEVAELILFLLSSKASFITGSLQTIDGGYTCQ